MVPDSDYLEFINSVKGDIISLQKKTAFSQDQQVLISDIQSDMDSIESFKGFGNSENSEKKKKSIESKLSKLKNDISSKEDELFKDDIIIEEEIDEILEVSNEDETEIDNIYESNLDKSGWMKKMNSFWAVNQDIEDPTGGMESLLDKGETKVKKQQKFNEYSLRQIGFAENRKEWFYFLPSNYIDMEKQVPAFQKIRLILHKMEKLSVNFVVLKDPFAFGDKSVYEKSLKKIDDFVTDILIMVDRGEIPNQLIKDRTNISQMIRQINQDMLTMNGSPSFDATKLTNIGLLDSENGTRGPCRMSSPEVYLLSGPDKVDQGDKIRLPLKALNVIVNNLKDYVPELVLDPKSVDYLLAFEDCLKKYSLKFKPSQWIPKLIKDEFTRKRNEIHKNLKEGYDKIVDPESSLDFTQKSNKIRELMTEYQDAINELKNHGNVSRKYFIGEFIEIGLATPAWKQEKDAGKQNALLYTWFNTNKASNPKLIRILGNPTLPGLFNKITPISTLIDYSVYSENEFEEMISDYMRKIPKSGYTYGKTIELDQLEINIREYFKPTEFSVKVYSKDRPDLFS